MTFSEKEAQVRHAILQAAARVFQRWGFAKTTMEDIAREAGKGKSTIYYYFRSKDDIIDVMVLAEVSQLLARAKAAVTQVDSAREKLRTYIVASLSEMKNVATVYRVVLTEIRENPRFLATLRKEFEAQEYQYLREILLLGVRQKEFTLRGRRELDAATRVLSGIIRSLELFLFLEDYNSDDVDMAARLVTYGI